VNPQFGSASLSGNIDNSIYHSGQATLRKQLSHGFTGQFNYTWSKNLGNSAAGNNSSGDTTANTRNPRNRQLQRGLIGFDRTHDIKAHGTWDLPFGSNRGLLSNAPAWLDRVVGGWQISSIFSWTSGAPLSFTSSRRTLGFKSNSNTADLVGKLPDDIGNVRTRSGFVEYFETLSTRRAATPNFGGDTSLAGRFANQVVVDRAGNIILQDPQPGTTGTTALNLPGVHGPSRLGLDMGLSKQIRIKENVRFTMRVDAINALNRPMWGNPNTDYNSASFGRITDATGARTITFNSRIDF